MNGIRGEDAWIKIKVLSWSLEFPGIKHLLKNVSKRNETITGQVIVDEAERMCSRNGGTCTKSNLHLPIHTNTCSLVIL